MSDSSSSTDELSICREFQEIGIKLKPEVESDVVILEKCFEICTTLHISAADLAMKYDAFKFTRKLGSKLDLSILKEFELYLRELLLTEKNSNNNKRKNHNIIKSAVNNPAKSLISNNTNRINHMNSSALSSMLSNSSDQIFDSLFNTNTVKREHLTQTQTPAKRKQQNMINHEANDMEFSSSAASSSFSSSFFT